VTPSPKAQLIVAIVILAAFALVVGFMLLNADGNPEVWERRVYVFSGVEAIVFTAVGWIFGREVHRGTAEQAKDDAKEAKAEAKDAKADAEKGQVLRGAIAALPDEPTATAGPSDRGARGAAGGSQVASLKDLAQKLYGE
jgi:hypothetical protein